ncbi:hypothetical protein CLI64_21250 [Nostoc sp. CENA543]|uniref:DUF2808 domain-containing protein n=1 Tax=Nostoc sp. CENA543 TaxID=1869241 RepID=UPI000CA273D1|nr:DUF2808 domain-containing protein [Nostoc sp. CENA543]AUT02720.1 hypothetical protein CLI64_21250 [Nostoc sp. CENA543]
MNNLSHLCKTLLVSTGLCLFAVPGSPISALAQAPKLLSTATTYNHTSAWDSTYYFTVTVPTTATPLQTIALTQITGLEAIDFDSQASYAFTGTSDRQGEKLGISLAKGSQPQTVIVNLNQAIAPGQTVTIALKPFRNPQYEGVYQFRVQSLAADKQTSNYGLGTARLQFYGVVDTE